MTDFEKRIYDTLINNAFLFLSETLKRLLDRDPEGDCKMDNNLITLTCAELQISLELAIRATLVHSFGLRSILKSDQASLSEQEIETLYSNNALKVTEFDKQKNFLKSKSISRLTKDDFKEIDRFQVYRNKIVHFSCEFKEDQLNELRDEVLYYIVHDMGDFYRVPADNRTLNYDKFFTEGDQERVKLVGFNSDNTQHLTVDECKAKMAELEYIKDELANWVNK